MERIRKDDQIIEESKSYNVDQQTTLWDYIRKGDLESIKTLAGQVDLNLYIRAAIDNYTVESLVEHGNKEMIAWFLENSNVLDYNFFSTVLDQELYELMDWLIDEYKLKISPEDLEDLVEDVVCNSDVEQLKYLISKKFPVDLEKEVYNYPQQRYLKIEELL